MRSLTIRPTRQIKWWLLMLCVLLLRTDANAAAPAWLSSMLKSKKPVAQQPDRVPNLSVQPVLVDPVVGTLGAPNGTDVGRGRAVRAAVPPASETRRSAVQPVGATIDPPAVGALPGRLVASTTPPSQAVQPRSLRSRTTDEYLRSVLNKVNANPSARGQFVARFPELRSDFSRTDLSREKLTQPPARTGTSASSLAGWLAGNAAGKKRAAPTVSKAVASANTGSENAAASSVQVGHEGDVGGPSVAEGANSPLAGAPGDFSTEQALAELQDRKHEPVVPEKYRNVTIDGVPKDARIMYVKDRVVRPAVPVVSPVQSELGDRVESITPPAAFPQNDPSALARAAETVTGSPAPLSDAAQSSAWGTSALGTPVLDASSLGMVPGSPLASNASPEIMKRNSTLAGAGATENLLANPSLSAASGSSTIGQKMQTYSISPQAIASQSLAPHAVSPAMIGSQVMASPVQMQGPRGAVPSITLPVSPGTRPISLTPEQLRQLPVGTRIVPASPAAAQTLRHVTSSGATAINPSAGNENSQTSLVSKQLDYAFQLCDENVVQAEIEFIETLRYIAKAHDHAEGMVTYGEALDRGLLTLREAEQVHAALEDEDEDAAIELASSLQSEVSQSYSEGKIATSEVMNAYYLYAQHSLMIALGKQSLGSQALYGWGQLCSQRSQSIAYNEAVERHKAEALLLASLEADKNNWRSYNELGIIHARNREYAKSERAFRRSLAIQPNNETYSNIAMVFDQQGKRSQAREARSKRSATPMIARSPGSGNAAQVNAEKPVQEETRRDKVLRFVDRLMGNDGAYQDEYATDDGIVIEP